MWTERTAASLCSYAKLPRAESQPMLDALASIMDSYQYFEAVQKEQPDASDQLAELGHLDDLISKTYARLANLPGLARMRVKNACAETPSDDARRIPAHDYEQALRNALDSLQLLTLAVPRAYDNLDSQMVKKAGRPHPTVHRLVMNVKQIFDRHARPKFRSEKAYRLACKRFVTCAIKESPRIQVMVPARLERVLFPELPKIDRRA